MLDKLESIIEDYPIISGCIIVFIMVLVTILIMYSEFFYKIFCKLVV